MNEIKRIITNLNGYKEVTSNVNRINKLLLKHTINIVKFFNDLLKIEKEETFLLMTLIIKKDCYMI